MSATSPPRVFVWSTTVHMTVVTGIEAGTMADGRRVIPVESLLTALRAPPGMTAEYIIETATRERLGVDADVLLEVCTALATGGGWPASWAPMVERATALLRPAAEAGNRAIRGELARAAKARRKPR